MFYKIICQRNISEKNIDRKTKRKNVNLSLYQFLFKDCNVTTASQDVKKSITKIIHLKIITEFQYMITIFLLYVDWRNLIQTR